MPHSLNLLACEAVVVKTVVVVVAVVGHPQMWTLLDFSRPRQRTKCNNARASTHMHTREMKIRVTKK